MTDCACFKGGKSCVGACSHLSSPVVYRLQRVQNMAPLDSTSGPFPEVAPCRVRLLAGREAGSCPWTESAPATVNLSSPAASHRYATCRAYESNWVSPMQPPACRSTQAWKISEAYCLFWTRPDSPSYQGRSLQTWTEEALEFAHLPTVHSDILIRASTAAHL